MRYLLTLLGFKTNCFYEFKRINQRLSKLNNLVKDFSELLESFYANNEFPRFQNSNGISADDKQISSDVNAFHFMVKYSSVEPSELSDHFIISITLTEHGKVKLLAIKRLISTKATNLIERFIRDCF